MKKKIAVISMTAVISLTAIFFCYLQFGREMDVGSSFSISSANYKEERINVILNKLVFTDSKEKTAETVIQHVLDNDFHSIRFSFDDGFPNELDVSVYKSDNDIQSGNLLFTFSYGLAYGETGAYDISQSEHMELKIYD